jgi:hypothetical protein
MRYCHDKEIPSVLAMADRWRRSLGHPVVVDAGQECSGGSLPAEHRAFN